MSTIILGDFSLGFLDNQLKIKPNRLIILIKYDLNKQKEILKEK